MKRPYSIRFERKVQDCWIGVYWKKNTHIGALHVWVCILPCFPLHMVFI